MPDLSYNVFLPSIWDDVAPQMSPPLSKAVDVIYRYNMCGKRLLIKFALKPAFAGGGGGADMWSAKNVSGKHSRLFLKKKVFLNPKIFGGAPY